MWTESRGRLGMRRTGRQIGIVSLVLAILTSPCSAAAAAATPGHGSMEESTGIQAIVPGGRHGEFRHGTFPSLGARTHMGVDIVAPCGSPVRALETGAIVDRIDRRSDPDFASLGYMVIVEHPASLVGRVFYSLYLHFQSPPTAAQTVARGDSLGRVGATGHATGCHVHFEVRYFRDRVSPLWGNIYGPGDQRDSPYMRDNWQDPVPFIARLERLHKVAAGRSSLRLDAVQAVDGGG